MRFSLPLLLDSAGETKSLFSVDTSAGSIVILFATDKGLDDFGEVAAELAARDGDKFGYTELEADSFADAVATLRGSDPTLSTATFVQDTSPLASELTTELSRLL
jgi:hypothetical protein